MAHNMCWPVISLDDVHDMVNVKSTGLPLGMPESFDDIEPHALFEASPSLRFYQYSDGLTEATSLTQDEF